jgi:hypothetical protein
MCVEKKLQDNARYTQCQAATICNSLRVWSSRRTVEVIPAVGRGRANFANQNAAPWAEVKLCFAPFVKLFETA